MAHNRHSYMPRNENGKVHFDEIWYKDRSKAEVKHKKPGFFQDSVPSGN